MGGREGEKNSYKRRGKGVNHKRLLNTENKLRVDEGVGERRKWVMGIERGTCKKKMGLTPRDSNWVDLGWAYNSKIGRAHV